MNPYQRIKVMKKIVGIKFRPGGKVYDFDSGAFVLKTGNCVIVETERGLGFGTVVVPPKYYDKSQLAELKKPLKKVFRLANQNDYKQKEKNIELEKHGYSQCTQYINELGLEMNLFSVESTFKGEKLTFFFTSEGRVDFRQLVKMLVKNLGVRIEMRQVGIRNQAKMCGGIGRCGRIICCSSFLEKFNPISIRMAKEQGLSLNPTKISGQCGRLMCCLTYEYDTYVTIKKLLPRVGTCVNTKRGKGKIIRHNVICNRVGVKLDEGAEIEVNLNEIQMSTK